jgi:hypothetical protein
MLYAPPQHARRTRDHYVTPPDVARALPIGLALAGLELPVPIYDPCCGEGALLDALGLPAFGSDLYPNDYASRLNFSTTPVDARNPRALAEAIGCARSIVCNPAYGNQAAAIVDAGVDLVRNGTIDLAAYLTPLPWIAAGSRVELMNSATLVITCNWRPLWIEGTKGGGKMNSCWIVWTRERTRFPLNLFVSRSQAFFTSTSKPAARRVSAALAPTSTAVTQA